jgi:hypothetical protein
MTAGRPKGRKDSYPRKRHYQRRPTHEASDVSFCDAGEGLSTHPGAPQGLVAPDPSSRDPRDVLWEVALDKRAPGAARVLAAKTLLQFSKKVEGEPSADRVPVIDRISARALELLAKGRMQ